MDTTELMKGAIDIHIHIGPDPNRRRRVNGYEAAIQAKEVGMRGVVFKSHDYNTTPVAYTVQQLVSDVELYGGVSLDVEVGGLNPTAVEAAGKLNSKIVWMYIEIMRHFGITEDEIITMIKTNPAKALGLPV